MLVFGVSAFPGFPSGKSPAECVKAAVGGELQKP